MTVETFFEKLELFAGFPNAVGKLRELIIRLAVRGKLVPKDQEDEPARSLLARIEKEKSRLVMEGMLRVSKPLSAISNAEKEFEAPANWLWVRLGTVAKLWNGFAFRSSDFQPTGVPVIRIGDLRDGLVDVRKAVRVSEGVADAIGTEFLIPKRALLIAMSGATTGKVAVNQTDQRLLLNQRVGSKRFSRALSTFACSWRQSLQGT